MREVILRPAVEADLEDKADYTIGEWGSDQARLYVGDLHRAIERLAASALRHPAQDDVLPGLRKLRCGHHLVFYFVREGAVDVVRVLHEKRDVRRYFGFEE
jgi:toxin ParE1/3/4